MSLKFQIVCVIKLVKLYENHNTQSKLLAGLAPVFNASTNRLPVCSAIA